MRASSSSKVSTLASDNRFAMTEESAGTYRELDVPAGARPSHYIRLNLRQPLC
jgi:hypothetical protein